MRRDVTILISSHILSEVERTTDRVGIIVRGKLLFEDTMENLRRRVSGGRRIQVEWLTRRMDWRRELRALPFVSGVSGSEQELTISTLDDRDYRTDVARAIAGHGGLYKPCGASNPAWKRRLLPSLKRKCKRGRRRNMAVQLAHGALGTTPAAPRG